MKRLFSFFLTIFLIYILGAPEAAGEEPFGSPKHYATFRVESAQTCPGMEVELGIYVDLMLGQPGGGSGHYEPGQLPPDPLDNFMFYIYISDTSLAEVVCSSVEDRGNGYKVGYPLLSDKMEELSGGNLTCGYIVGGREMDSRPTMGRFTCIWTRSRQSTKLIPTHHAPLFKIRVRYKAAGTVTIGVEDPNEIAFSTGLAQLGGYYYRFWNGSDGSWNNRIKGTITPAPGPDKALVSAGPDRAICQGTRNTLNAEGGKSYRWSQVYNDGLEGGYQPEGDLTNRNTKNPTFIPSHRGVYVYQVEAFDEKGCFTRDTVVYDVRQNMLEGLVSIDPADGPMIDSGSRVKFTLNGGPTWSDFKMRVTLTPDSLFEEGKNVLESDGPTLNGTITTKPVYEPTMVTATFEDNACQEQVPAVIRIKGVDVTGKIAPFPVYRCGNDRKIKSLSLNLLTRGGSGQFLYTWRATDLEFTDNPKAAPRIDKPNARTPKLTYYGRSAISVDIFDMVTGKTVTISDTMIYRDWLQATTAVSIDTAAFDAEGLSLEGPYCEGTTHTYKANSVYAGEGATYLWQVNGIWKEEGIDQDRFTAALHKGDSVSCVLYSTEACVANVAVESEPFALDIRYPVMPTIELANLDVDGIEYCSSVELQATCHSVGKRFRIQWLRNGNTEIDSVVLSDNPDLCVVRASFPRQSFYDGFECRIVETDMPCGNFDTVYATVEQESMTLTCTEPGKDCYSGTLYTFFNAGAGDYLAPEARGVQMPEEAVCNTEPFTLTAQVGNLSENFELRWYKKAGEDSVLLGFYGYPHNGQTSDYRLHGWGIYGYPSGQSLEDMLPVIQDGFKIILNDPQAAVSERRNFTPGDTVFFVLESNYSKVCDYEQQTYVLRSPYFVPQMLEPSNLAELSIKYVEDVMLCPGDNRTYHLAASLPGEDYYMLDWKFEDISVTDSSEESGNPAQYFKLLGPHNDTLQSRIVVRTNEQNGVGTWGSCTATVTKGCNAGKTLTATFDLRDKVHPNPFFRISHNPDTIVCADQPVEHWARIEEVSRNSETRNAGNEKEYEVHWATSLQDLLGGRYASNDRNFTHTPTPNGNQPNNSGDYEDNRGIFGYYIQAIEPTSGCEVIDSVFVMVAHPYQVKATLDFLYDGPWCDSSDYVQPDYSHKIEGLPSTPGGQYAFLRIENGGPSPRIEWGLNDEVYTDMPYDTLDMAGAPDGDTLKAWVTTSMYTCLPEKTAVEPVVIRSSVMGDLYSHAPETAHEGEEILLQSYVASHVSTLTGLDNYEFTYSLQQADGSWLELGKGNSERKGENIDSLLTAMPGHTGKFMVEARDKYSVCPARRDYMDVALAVSTGISMKAFDPATGREITALCPQTYSFVYADGQPAPETAALWVNDTREPIDVWIRTYPKNPGRNAYVGYWKNGSMRAVGPVGSAGALNFDPSEEGFDCQILEKGDTITAHILPGDWFGAFYIHDTVSIDGQYTSHSNQITLDVDTTGSLTVTASPTAVCPNQQVNLKAEFGNDNITWLPQGAFQTENGLTASALPAQTTVYTAVGYDANGCARKDSVLVNTVSDGARLPIAIRTDSLQFCGQSALVKVEMDQSVSHAADFTRFDWYELGEGAPRLIDSTTEPSLLCEVADGMRLMVQAQPVLTCQDGLSLSDTLTFEGFDLPVLRRLQPLSDDVAACPNSDVEIVYEISPDNAVVEWYGEVENYREFLDDVTDRFVYEGVTEDAMFEVYAMNPGKLSCMVADTVRVRVSRADAGAPKVSLAVDRDVVCGAVEVTYTAAAENCDLLQWYVNGGLMDAQGLSLARVPRISGLEGDADTVYVVGVRQATECTEEAEARSLPVLVWRVEKPTLKLFNGDTTVYEGNPVLLRAEASAYDGPSPVITWHDSEGEQIATGSPYELKNESKGEYLYYVLAQQADLEEELPECYSYDSLTVTVLEKTAIETGQDALVSVHPNPSTGKFTLSVSVPCRVEIFSLTGTRVWFAEQAEGDTEIEIRQAGVYFVKAATPNGNVIRKLIVR
ncbi:MAG: T9SS type A sorting domain-containing protein [Bacteroides sp.]|nr:T9SS type A sorting domain-containing protein [Ruminococcus flavefaciens]MCM1555721.1 T9SS type A sorting domain-containing protein [Bacteroides sp.]